MFQQNSIPGSLLKWVEAPSGNFCVDFILEILTQKESNPIQFTIEHQPGPSGILSFSRVLTHIHKYNLYMYVWLYFFPFFLYFCLSFLSFIIIYHISIIYLVSIQLSTHPPINPSIHKSIHWSIHQSIHRSIDPLIYLLIHPSTQYNLSSFRATLSGAWS